MDTAVIGDSCPLAVSFVCIRGSLFATLRLCVKFFFAFSRLFHLGKSAHILDGRFERGFKHLGSMERPVRIAEHLAG